MATITVRTIDDDPREYVLAPDHVRDALQYRFDCRPDTGACCWHHRGRRPMRASHTYDHH